MNGNLGMTSLRKRRRNGNTMLFFDSLPLPLKNWLAHAVLPWSPHSCLRVWKKGRAQGESIEKILERLDRAEAQMLAKDRINSWTLAPISE